MADEKTYRPKKDAEGLTIDVTVGRVQDQPKKLKPEDGGALGVEIVRVGGGNLSWPVNESALRDKGVLDVVANHPLVTDRDESPPARKANQGGND